MPRRPLPHRNVSLDIANNMDRGVQPGHHGLHTAGFLFESFDDFMPCSSSSQVCCADFAVDANTEVDLGAVEETLSFQPLSEGSCPILCLHSLQVCDADICNADAKFALGAMEAPEFLPSVVVISHHLHSLLPGISRWTLRMMRTRNFTLAQWRRRLKTASPVNFNLNAECNSISSKQKWC